VADSQSRLKPDGLLVFGYQRPDTHCDEKVKQAENERDTIVADQSSQAPLQNEPNCCSAVSGLVFHRASHARPLKWARQQALFRVLAKKIIGLVDSGRRRST
jgi:hypothetical protein